MNQIKDTTVCIFACNRTVSLENTLKDLRKNRDFRKYTYHFFIDAPKKKSNLQIYKNIIQIIKKFQVGLKVKIISRKKNIGLSKNIIKGINFIKKKYKKFIILEDDLRISKNYLNYMQYNLDNFENDMNIFTVTGYIFPKKIFNFKLKTNSIFLCKRPNSWGWGSWSSKWNKVNFNNKNYDEIYRNKNKIKIISIYGNDLKYILKDTLNKKTDSWAIKWTIYHILKKKYCIFPFKTLVNEEGFKSNPSNNKFKSNKFYHKRVYNIKFKKNILLNPENKNIIIAFKKIYNFPLYKKLIKNFLIKN